MNGPRPDNRRSVTRSPCTGRRARFQTRPLRQGKMPDHPARRRMHVISPEQYEQLRAGAQVIEADSHGEKVLRLADGNYLKLFRRKRLLSSALLWPYAQRFASNARQLARLGIPCPQVIALYKLKTPRRDIVHYQPLPGRTLRQLRDAGQPLPEGLFEQFGRFMAELHQQGVYFRSAHLGNVVLTPEGRL